MSKSDTKRLPGAALRRQTRTRVDQRHADDAAAHLRADVDLVRFQLAFSDTQNAWQLDQRLLLADLRRQERSTQRARRRTDGAPDARPHDTTRRRTH